MKVLFHFSAVCVLGAALLASSPSTAAPQAAKDSWPALPKFDLNDNYTAWEKNYVKTQVMPAYNFTERTPEPLPASRLWQVPGLGDEAFELLSLPRKGAFTLAPGQSDSEGSRYITLNLRRLDPNAATPSSQMYYRAVKSPKRLHSPLLSPDGKVVLLREGLPPDDRYVGNNLYLWNLNEGKLRFVLPGPADTRTDGTLFLPISKWSPGSRFVSYLRGGNTLGDYDARSEPYLLYCLDVPSRRDHLVMKNAGLVWSWTYHGQILCSHVAPSEGPATLWNQNPRPSVYVANASGGAPRKLFDGGYYAQESPDGNWIAFLDWPGPLLEPGTAPKEVKENDKQGLFLFHKPSGRRIFVGETPISTILPPRYAPLLQWAPDGQSLFFLVRDSGAAGVTGTVSRMDIEQQQLQPLATLTFAPSGGARQGYFEARGTSPDGRFLYYEQRETIDGPKGFPNQQFTLLSVDARSGQSTPIARLKNIANENPDWDWHDDSGQNPAFAAAQKIENAPAAGPAAATRPAAKPKPTPRARTRRRTAP